MDKSNHRNNGAFIFCVILILGDRNLFHKRILCNHKNDFLKNKEKPENTAPQKEKITLKLHNYFSYTKKCLKNKKLIFTQTQFSVLRHYNKAPTLENQWDNPAADLGATWLETQYIFPFLLFFFYCFICRCCQMVKKHFELIDYKVLSCMLLQINTLYLLLLLNAIH